MKLFIIGYMGSGKTHWGKKLSKTLGLPLWDLDEEIIAREGMNIPQIFERYGEEYFRKTEKKCLRTLSEKREFILSCGGGTPCHFDNMTFMNQQGLTLWLNVPEEVMANRLKRGRKNRPLLSHLKEKQLPDFVHQKLQERKPYYKQAQLILNPIEYNVQSLTEKIKLCIEPT